MARWPRGLATLLLLVLAACARPARPVDRAVWLIDAPAETLDGRFALSGNAQRVARLISPGLLTFDAQGRAIPDLAESFAWRSPTELVVELRRGARFHDGSLVTSADVVATFEGLRDPAMHAPIAARLEPLEAIEPDGARRVRFLLKRPHAPLLAELGVAIVPLAWADAAHAAEFATAPIGAGPFRLVRREGEEEVELEAFAEWFGGTPTLPGLLIRTRRDESTRLLELARGEADLLLNAVSPQLLPVAREMAEVRVESEPGSGHAYLLLDTSDPALADPRVREALSCALDRKTLVAAKFQGLARPAIALLPPEHWAARPGTVCDDDLAAAERLLDAAGLPPASSGKPRLTLSLKSSTDRFRRSVAEAIAFQWARAGIAVEQRALEFGTFTRDLKAGAFQVATLKWSSVLEPDLLRLAHGAGPEGMNRSRLHDPRIEALLQEAAEATGESDRAERYLEAQALLGRALPTIPLWHEDVVVVRSTRLEGIHLGPHGFVTGLARARLRERRW